MLFSDIALASSDAIKKSNVLHKRFLINAHRALKKGALVPRHQNTYTGLIQHLIVFSFALLGSYSLRHF